MLENFNYVRFEVLTGVKMMLFWVVIPCGIVTISIWKANPST
jgi:hypothetical protein